MHMRAHLHKCSLNLTICTGSLTESSSSNSVDFVHEDNARFVFLSVGEHFSNHSCRLSDVLIDNLQISMCSALMLQIECSMTRDL